MPLPAGTKLGTYEVVTAIGAGGMGEVYQAHDTKLVRDVAIKVLPEAVAHDPEKLSRFQREAKLLASLNHPNIATIHNIEDSNGTTYLVMELVPGETLAERVKREGAVPVEESLAIAKQIAEALEAAHEKGIIHRDLKPANVKLTPEGKVKVLDFGLAKAFAGDTSTEDMGNSPTLSMAATMQGVILGTPAYMSPEQAKGRAVDKRTDIFAFGSVLYEMLTGKRAFDGEDVAEILASVLKTEPDWTQLPADVSPSIQKLLRLCLEKNPKNRRRDAGDILIDIEQALKTEPAVVSTDVRRKLRFARAVTVMFVLVSAVAVGMLLTVKAPNQAKVRFDIETPPISNLKALPVALSPDGRYLTSIVNEKGGYVLWVRALDDLKGHVVTGTEFNEGTIQFPFWSPDGHFIGFFADGKLKKVDIFGTPPQTLCDANGLG